MDRNPRLCAASEVDTHIVNHDQFGLPLGDQAVCLTTQNSHQNECSDIHSKRGKFEHITTLKEIMTREEGEISWIIPDILPEGLCVFAGGPKVGKSWFGLSLAIAVASGGNIFGDTPVRKGEVIYVALEDYPRRIKNRASQLIDLEDCPDGIHFDFKFPKLDQDGKKYLAELIVHYPNCVLIVIDTLGRARSTKGTGGKNIYDIDTELMGDIHDVISGKGICVLFIHHIKKDQNVNDPFDAVSGSMGITGAADTNWVLKKDRGSSSGNLTVTGRDVADQILSLEFDVEACVWRRTEESTPVVKAGTTFQKILDCFESSDESKCPKDVAKETGLNHDNVKKAMGRMVVQRLLIKVEKGFYKKAVTLSPDDLNQDIEAISAETEQVSPIFDVPEDEMEAYLSGDFLGTENEESPIDVSVEDELSEGDEG